MLVADGLTKRFHGLTALDELSIEVGADECVGIVGPNGSGKSTLLNALSGFGAADRGAVSFDGKRIERRNPSQIARLGLRRTFQHAAQPNRLTVLELMLLGAPLPIGASVAGTLLRPRAAAKAERQAVDRAREMLDQLTLARLENEAAGSLSGGQQKLLALGAVLMARPRMLLLDEPAAGVNPTLRKTLVRVLRETRTAGTSIVVIEHDMSFVADLCERVYVLDRGSVVTCVPPNELATDPRVVAAYLGTSADVENLTGGMVQ